MILWLAQQATNAGASSGGNPTALWWGMGLTALALVLFVVEFIVPSGGLLGLLCAGSAIGSIIAFFMVSQTAGVAALFVYLGVGPIIIWVVIKFWFGSRMGKRMILGADVTLPEDSEEALRASEHARQERLQELKESRPADYERMVAAQSSAEQRLESEGLHDDPLRIHTRRYDEIVKLGMQPYSELFNDDLGPGGWENINRAHYALIEKVLDSQAYAGQRILITFGAWHKYWFIEQLEQRDDIVLRSLSDFSSDN